MLLEEVPTKLARATVGTQQMSTTSSAIPTGATFLHGRHARKHTGELDRLEGELERARAWQV
jgi:hypothetical protein